MQNDWVACTLRRILLHAAPLGLFCALSLHAQEPTPANSGPLPAAPVPQQINFTGNSFIEPAAPASSQPVLKNNRLFYVLANYSTVEKHDEFSTLSARTKF